MGTRPQRNQQKGREGGREGEAGGGRAPFPLGAPNHNPGAFPISPSPTLPSIPGPTGGLVTKLADEREGRDGREGGRTHCGKGRGERVGKGLGIATELFLATG